MKFYITPLLLIFASLTAFCQDKKYKFEDILPVGTYYIVTKEEAQEKCPGCLQDSCIYCPRYNFTNSFTVEEGVKKKSNFKLNPNEKNFLILFKNQEDSIPTKLQYRIQNQKINIIKEDE